MTRPTHMDNRSFPQNSLEDTTMEYTSALGKAIALWTAGYPISLSLYAELVEQGYDVPALENHYMQ